MDDEGGDDEHYLEIADSRTSRDSCRNIRFVYDFGSI